MENTQSPTNNEKNLEREMLEMNKQTIKHLEKDAERWFKSWWMLSIVYPMIMLLVGSLIFNKLTSQNHAATAAKKPVLDAAARRAIIRDVVNTKQGN